MDGKSKIVMSQFLKPNRSDNRGGKRENSGRKPEGRKPYGKRVTPEERLKLDVFLLEIRLEAINNFKNK